MMTKISRYKKTIQLLALGLFPTVALALPSFTISGVLQDADGNPLPNVSTAAVRVEFFASESGEAPLDAMETSCSVQRGVFAVNVEPTRKLLGSQGPIWYSLSIDTDGNGLDDGDKFSGRFSITPAFSTLKNEQISQVSHTHGGFGAGITGGLSEPNRVAISPFVTDSSGVAFDFICYKTAPSGPSSQPSPLSNIAIYDQAGNKVAETGPHTVTWADVHFSTLTRTFSAQGYLEPDSLYYVAFVCTGYASVYPPAVTMVDPFFRDRTNSDLITSNAELPGSLAIDTVKLSQSGVNLMLIRADTEEQKSQWMKRSGADDTTPMPTSEQP